MKTYWYSVNYTFYPNLNQLHFKINKYTPPSDGIYPSHVEHYDHENNMHVYTYITDAIYKCECEYAIYKCECEHAMDAVFKIKSRISQDNSNSNYKVAKVVFDESFNKLMYEETAKDYNIAINDITELFC